MNIKYDKEADAFYLKLSDAEVVESDQEKPEIIIDYDDSGNMVGIEVFDASEKTGNPASLIYEVA